MRTLDEIKDIADEIKKFLIREYGNGIKQVLVYGSFARGEATENSDIDMAVIIDDSLNAENVEKELSDFLFDILLERKELISVFAIPESIFENYNSPFILNTKAEGVAI
ncbi:MAG: nucleotidyltransferase family protein [Promethearchaeota archaeon]